MASARIFVKRQVVLKNLNLDQRRMFLIGNAAVASVKNRLAAGQNVSDGPAKPLGKRYAIRKTKAGKGNRRTLSLTGDMLRNFMVRTVKENTARAYPTGRGSVNTARSKKGRAIGVENKIKAWVNQKIEPWAVLSPRNLKVVWEVTKRVTAELAPRLAIEKFLGNGGKR